MTSLHFLYASARYRVYATHDVDLACDFAKLFGADVRTESLGNYLIYLK